MRRADGPDRRDRGPEATVWLSARVSAAPSGRLVRQPQARLPAVPRSGSGGAAAEAQTHWPGRAHAAAEAAAGERQLVDGLRIRRTDQWQAASRPEHRG